jgi:hypothetical protein
MPSRPRLKPIQLGRIEPFVRSAFVACCATSSLGRTNGIASALAALSNHSRRAAEFVSRLALAEIAAAAPADVDYVANLLAPLAEELRGCPALGAFVATLLRRPRFGNDSAFFETAMPFLEQQVEEVGRVLERVGTSASLASSPEIFLRFATRMCSRGLSAGLCGLVTALSPADVNQLLCGAQSGEFSEESLLFARIWLALQDGSTSTLSWIGVVSGAISDGPFRAGVLASRLLLLQAEKSPSGELAELLEPVVSERVLELFVEQEDSRSLILRLSQEVTRLSSLDESLAEHWSSGIVALRDS